MANPDKLRPTPITPDNRHSGFRNFVNPLQVIETPAGSVDAPYQVTQAVQGAIDLGRRVIDVKRHSREGMTVIHTLSPQTPYTEGDIPGKDRPYKIYESLTPEDSTRLSGK